MCTNSTVHQIYRVNPWFCLKMYKFYSVYVNYIIGHSDNVGYTSYSGNSTMVPLVLPSPDNNRTNRLNLSPQNLGQYDDIVTPRATGRSHSPEDSGLYDDVIEGEAWVHQSPADSGEYDIPSPERGIQRFMVSTNPDSGKEAWSTNEGCGSLEMRHSYRSDHTFELSKSLTSSFKYWYENVALCEDTVSTCKWCEFIKICVYAVSVHVMITLYSVLISDKLYDTYVHTYHV